MNAQSKAVSASRRGFTLVELLVMIVIIGILSSLVLGGLFVAQEKAKATRTRALVTRLNQAVMARMESYRTRRLPVSTSAANQGVAAVSRRDMIRELMRMEMPDRWTDVADGAVTPGLPVGWRPALSTAYLRRYSNNVNEAGTAALPTELEQNAECLYLIVTMGGLDEEASGLDRFRHEDVEDTDHDGAPEFVDGWGNPIRFLRWAPGFVSDLQPDSDPSTVDDPSTPEVEDLDRDPINNHDPFDPLKTDMPAMGGAPRAFRLVPLIYSAGPDGVYDIRGDLVDSGGALFHYNATTPFPNDPYHDPDPSQAPDNTRFIGGAFDFDADGLSHVDNIHNHLLGGAVR